VIKARKKKFSCERVPSGTTDDRDEPLLQNREKFHKIDQDRPPRIGGQTFFCREKKKRIRWKTNLFLGIRNRVELYFYQEN